jgi:hypothetical protein
VCVDRRAATQAVILAGVCVLAGSFDPSPKAVWLPIVVGNGVVSAGPRPLFTSSFLSQVTPGQSKIYPSPPLRAPVVLALPPDHQVPPGSLPDSVLPASEPFLPLFGPTPITFPPCQEINPIYYYLPVGFSS